MNNRLRSTYSRNLASQLDALGIKAPKSLADAIATAEKVVAGYQAMPQRSVPAAVDAALAAGHDPATDPDVQAAVTAQAIAAINDHGTLADRAADRVVAAAAATADEVVKLLRTRFDPAVEQLTELHAAAGGLDLDQLEAGARQGPAVVAALSRARYEILPVLAQVVGAWTALYALIDPIGASPKREHAALAWLNPDPTAWLDAELDRNPPQMPTGPWTVVGTDHHLVLATLSEFRDRVQRIATAKRDAAASAAAAAEEQRRMAPNIYKSRPAARA